MKKIKTIYNYLRIDLNIVFNIPYDFILEKPIANKEKYIEVFNKIKNLKYEEIDNFEKKCGYF